MDAPPGDDGLTFRGETGMDIVLTESIGTAVLEEVKPMERATGSCARPATSTDSGLLTEEQESRLVRALQGPGREAARQELASANLRLVTHIAKRYANRGVMVDDLIGAGVIGLLRAIDRFDAGRGVRLSSYAYPYIEHAVRHALTQVHERVRFPKPVMVRLRRWREATRDLKVRLGVQPSVQDVARHLGVSFREAQELERLARVAAHDPLAPDGSGNEGTSREEGVGREPAGVAHSMSRGEQAALLRGLLGELDEREAHFLGSYYGLHGARPMTICALAESTGLPRGRVVEILDRGVRKLRARVVCDEKLRASLDAVEVT
jgi:RNA polymerase primary sigma factor